MGLAGKLTLFCFALSLAACDHSEPAKTESPNDAACRALVAGLPPDYVHGTVEVPEDYDNPAGRTIHVFYYGRIGSGAVPSTAFYNGGPASDSHGAYTIMKEAVEQKADTRAAFPILFIDQRGTGCSTPFPAVADAADLVRMGHYASKEIVKDSEVIRKKLLGSEKWKVFGQSFGGLIAKRYLQIAPEGVRSLHIHGFSSNNDPLTWLAERLKSQKRLADEFFSSHPGDEAKYRAAESLFTDTVCVQDAKNKVCGKTILYRSSLLLGFQAYWPLLHQLITELVKNGALDMAIVRSYAAQVIFSGSGSGNPWAGLVISWVDQGQANFGLSSCTELYRRLHLTGETPETWPLHECKTAMAPGETGDIDTQIQAYLGGVPKNQLTLDTLVTLANRSPEIPIFLYSGAKDSFVPTETFTEEVRLLGSRVHYVNFSASGHEGFYTETKVWENLLADGAVPGPVVASTRRIVSPAPLALGLSASFR